VTVDERYNDETSRECVCKNQEDHVDMKKHDCGMMSFAAANLVLWLTGPHTPGITGAYTPGIKDLYFQHYMRMLYLHSDTFRY